MALDVSPPPDRLLRWCRAQLGALTERGSIQKVELWHDRDGTHRERIETLSTREGADPEDTAQRLTDAARAEAEASLTPGALRFEAVAYDSLDARDPHVSKVAFIVDAASRPRPFGEAANNRAAGGSATDQGIAALVRASTETQRIVMEKVESILSIQARQMEMLAAKNTELTAANFSAMEHMSRLAFDQRREEAELVKVQFGERRKQQVFETAMGFLPLLLAQAKGDTPAAKALAGKSDDPLRVALRGLIQGLDAEQFMGLMEKLPPEKQALFGQVAMIVSEDLEKLEDKLPPEPPEPK